MRDVLIGVDVGGTFTDAVVVIGHDKCRAKSFSTYPDIGRGVLQSCRLAARSANLTLEALLPRVRRFGLGTTAVTNVIAARTGLRVGLLTTKGFEETLRIARGRVHQTDGWLHPPPLLVEQNAIVGIDERIDSRGEVVVPLDDTAVREAARHFRRCGVDSVAVSFLWSFLNPAHERRAVSILTEELPDLRITGAAELRPVIREYERTTLAVLNAYSFGAYAGVEELAGVLRDAGMAAPVLLCHSGGGSMSIDQARQQPVWLAASGPAAGVAAAAHVAVETGDTQALTCDLGGTSFDVAHLHGGAPARIQRGDLMGIFTALPRVNVESVGAGGGSVGWIDERGMLRVGPHSVGSSPGPVCYGRGGLRPALTDALLVLGYIDADRFLGGQMKLDRTAATAACAKLGERLGLDALETAWGIRGIALAGMLKAARSRLSGHALLASEYSLVSYGGCGGLFASEVAAKSGLRRVLVPELASVLSAYGAATMDIRLERLASLLLPLPCDQAPLDSAYASLREAVRRDLAADGVPENDRVIQFEADLRFVGQRWEITVSLPAQPKMGDCGEELQSVFRNEYRRRFGPAATSASNIVELVSLRAVGIGRMDTPAVTAVPVGDAPAKRTPPVGSRRVQIDRARPDSLVSTYNAVDLEPGHCFSGPGLVDGTDMTIWVPDGMHAKMNAHRTLIIDSRP